MPLAPQQPSLSPHPSLSVPSARRPVADRKVYRKAKLLPFGDVTLRYAQYRNRWSTYYMLFYRQGGKLKRECRTSFAALKRRAETIANAIANGQAAMAAFTETDRATYQAALDLAGSPAAIIAAVTERAEHLKLLAGRATSLEAVREYLARHPDGLIPRTSNQVADELLLKFKGGAKWRRNLEKMLERFTFQCPGPLPELQTRALDDWLDSLPGGLRTRRNHRAALARLVHFAQARNYLPADWSVLDQVSDPEPPAPLVTLYTPDELLRLLHKAETTVAGRKLLPLVAITAFAGVRHGEMNEEKLEHLDWSDLDFEARSIYITRAAAKTGADRVVDMPENLVQWLTPYRKTSGRICSLSNTSNALCRLRARAGITGNKRNALRKSFISYRLALTRNIEATADQAGNSAGVIRKNYKRVDTRMRQAAERWFSIAPTRAEILPLFQWAAK